MFSDFLAYFNESNHLKYTNDTYSDFISQLGGKRFGNGLFNSFSADNVVRWSEIVSEAYPDFRDKFQLFGYDWLGRCFGIDLRDSCYGNVLMFEIGTGDVLEIPCPFKEFLNEEIPLYSDACLAETFFNEWMEYSKETIAYGRCVGYKIPLFLGGEDTIANLENSDMETYWSVVSQIKSGEGAK